jgi:two-component system sensor kinase FixL
MLNGQLAADGEVDAALSDISADAMRASRVLQRLRLLCRKGHVEYRALDLGELITDTLVLLRGDIRLKQITVDVAPPGGSLPPVLGDPIQLQQVLMNLLVNAGEAIAAALAGPRRITVEVAVDEPGRVRVSVRDTGIGLAEEAVERVFVPFVTGKSGGLGMGLSISRSIVEAHGGRIWATREPTGGAAMHVVLPCALDERAGPAAALDPSAVRSATA